MAALNDSIDLINSILDPRLSQVIGSTPESITDLITRSGMENNSKLGSKFICIAVFAASVKKSVAEELFIAKEMEDLRAKITNTFVLNGKLNMTAMTLAGHCFTLSTVLTNVKYITEFRKKIGGDNIWDADITKGSASEKMKAIMTQKAKTHNKTSCAAFATWFVTYTGIAPKSNKGKGTQSSLAFVPPQVQDQALLKDKPTVDVSIPAEIDRDLLEDWKSLTGKTEAQLAKSISDVGVKTTVARMQRDIKRVSGEGTDTVVGSSSGGV